MSGTEEDEGLPEQNIGKALCSDLMGQVKDLMEACIQKELAQKEKVFLKKHASKLKDLEERELALKVAQQELEAGRDALKADIDKFEEERRRLAQGTSMQDIIRLNIGGEKTIAVQRSTLCAVDNSMLASYFSGRWDDTPAKDSDGAFFVDFDPELFLPLVAYLRSKRIENPATPTPRPHVEGRNTDLSAMLDFYGLAQEMPLLKFSFKFKSIDRDGWEIGNEGFIIKRISFAHWKRAFGDCVLDRARMHSQVAAMKFKLVAFGSDTADTLGVDEHRRIHGPCVGVAHADLTRINDETHHNKQGIWSYCARSGDLFAEKAEDILGDNPRPSAQLGDVLTLLCYPDGRIELLKNNESLGIIFCNVPQCIKPVVEATWQPSEIHIVD